MARDLLAKASLGQTVRISGGAVTSVNGMTGDVVLDAESVGALPADTPIPALDGYATEEWVEEQGYLTEHQDISGKADIEDIPTKVSDLQNDAGYITQHQSLANYALKSELPTKTSDLTNDSGFLTQHQDISGKADKSEIPTKVSELTNDAGYLTQHQSLSGYATETWVGQQGYLTQHQSLANYALKSEIPTVTNDFTDAYKDKVDTLWEDYQDAITALG